MNMTAVHDTFRLDVHGDFSAKAVQNISGAQIFIEAFNGKIWGGSQKYLFKFSSEVYGKSTDLQSTENSTESANLTDIANLNSTNESSKKESDQQ